MLVRVRVQVPGFMRELPPCLLDARNRLPQYGAPSVRPRVEGPKWETYRGHSLQPAHEMCLTAHETLPLLLQLQLVGLRVLRRRRRSHCSLACGRRHLLKTGGGGA